MNDTNTTTKPGVLNVMHRYSKVFLPNHGLDGVDMLEACATVERLAGALQVAHDALVLCYTETCGIRGFQDLSEAATYARDLATAELAAFRGEQT